MTPFVVSSPAARTPADEPNPAPRQTANRAFPVLARTSRSADHRSDQRGAGRRASARRQSAGPDLAQPRLVKPDVAGWQPVEPGPSRSGRPWSVGPALVGRVGPGLVGRAGPGRSGRAWSVGPGLVGRVGPGPGWSGRAPVGRAGSGWSGPDLVGRAESRFGARLVKPDLAECRTWLGRNRSSRTWLVEPGLARCRLVERTLRRGWPKMSWPYDLRRDAPQVGERRA